MLVSRVISAQWLTLACLIPIASGIVTRSDKNAAEFYKKEGNYECAFTYDPEYGKLKDCACSCGATMINDNWAVSAAHCFAQGPTKLNGKSVLIKGMPHKVEEVFLHPCGLEANYRIDHGQDNIPNKDVALIKFASAVKKEGKSIACPMYPGKFGSEKGKTITIVGTGLSGVANMRDEELQCDWKVRRAQNVVENTLNSMIQMKFDNPTKSKDLEGIAGDGDSGGPAFIDVNGVPHIAAVSSYGDPTGASGRTIMRFRGPQGIAQRSLAPELEGLSFNRTRTRSGGRCMGRRSYRAMRSKTGDVWGYNSLDFYAALSDVSDWIESVMKTGENNDKCTDYK